MLLLTILGMLLALAVSMLLALLATAFLMGWQVESAVLAILGVLMLVLSISLILVARAGDSSE